MWAVELQETHRVIGQIYFTHIEPQHLMTGELGFIFRREGLLRQNIFFRQNALGEPMWTDTFVYAMLASH